MARSGCWYRAWHAFASKHTPLRAFLRARVSPAPEVVEESIEVEALMRNVVEQFGRMADLVPSIPPN